MNAAPDPALPSFLRVSPSEQNKDTSFLKNINKDSVILIGLFPHAQSRKGEELYINKQVLINICCS